MTFDLGIWHDVWFNLVKSNLTIIGIGQNLRLQEEKNFGRACSFEVRQLQSEKNLTEFDIEIVIK